MGLADVREMFEPKGEKPEWEMLYDFLKQVGKGEVVEYQQLSNALGRDLLKSRTPIYKAMQRLEAQDNRSLANVPGVGYRITTAQEHEGLARSHHLRSRRQLKKSHSKIKSADRTELSREERQRFDALEMAVKQQADMLRRLESRVTRVEERQEVQQDATSEKLDKLTEALKRHGIEV